MPDTLDKLLKQAEQLEKKKDYEKLAGVYRQIATIYHKQKNKIKNDEFLAKSKEAKRYAPIKEKKINQSVEQELEKIEYIQNLEVKYSLLKELVEKHVNHSELLSKLGILATDLKLYKEAIQWFERVLKLIDKDDSLYLSKIHHNIATINTVFLNDYYMARKHFEIAYKLNPKDCNIINNFAILLTNDFFKEFDLSRVLYEKAIIDSATNFELYNNYATLLMITYQDYDLAIQYYKKALEINPKSVDANTSIALLLSTDYYQEYELSRKYYEYCLEINKDYTVARVEYAYLLSNDYFKEYNKARDIYIDIIKAEPNNSSAYHNFAILLSNDYFKEYELAKNYYEHAIALNPSFFGSYHNLAILYFENYKNTEKAQYYFAKAIEINKNSIFTRKALAKTIEKIPFITKIDIQNLRHIKNLQIELDTKEARHLMLTGSNGSGKTTVLNECKNFLQKVLETPIDELFTEKSRNEIFEPKEYTLRLNFNVDKLTEVRLAYESGVFVVKYLGANIGEGGNRGLNAEGVKSIEKVELPFVNRIEENLADKIVAYLVDMNYTRLLAKDENDKATAEKIDKWFHLFLEILQSIDPDIVELKRSTVDNKHSFELLVKLPAQNNEIVNVQFKELPDGFKATFKIVFEILLQMQSKVQTTYDIPGIVMIDEPELFLHIKMQKKIMPALTKLFPHIQFIVATHSPYVLNSISNAVIYDLETRQRLVDVSDIPADKLSEYYFSFSKQYVESIQKKVNEFAELVTQYRENQLDDANKKRLAELEIELDDVTPYISDEYFAKFKDNQKYLYE